MRTLRDGARPAREGRRIARRPIQERLARLDWEAIARSLDERGSATTPALLDAGECAALVRLWADERRFRSRVDMARLRFGVGEYKYFAAPLPPLVAGLRVDRKSTRLNSSHLVISYAVFCLKKKNKKKKTS